MYNRSLFPFVIQSIQKYPTITLVGPRQSGKTTLAKMCFPQAKYISLEDLDVRRRAIDDPRSLLSGLPELAIIDEVQRAPDILSYIQTITDEGKQKFILTGSHQLLLTEKISQTLSGRTRIFELMPLSYRELIQEAKNKERSTLELMLQGGYPRIHKDHLNPYEWYQQYIKSYIERDVREIINIGDLILFERFLRLTGGRAAQTINYTQLGNDCGVKTPTAMSWISLMCASYICFLLPPYFVNFNKRYIKTPKLYFYDTGVLCTILNIRNIEQLENHPLLGHIFENFIVSEFYKNSLNVGEQPPYYFYRDQKRNEVDLIEEDGQHLKLFEIKYGQTFQSEWIRGLEFLKRNESKSNGQYLIYNGSEDFSYENVQICNWRKYFEMQ